MTQPIPNIQLPGAFAIPSAAPVYVDSVPIQPGGPGTGTLASVPAATRQHSSQDFWSTDLRAAGDPAIEQLVVHLAQPRLINYVSLDVAHFPHVLQMWYWDGEAWAQVARLTGGPLQITTTGSVPTVVDNPAALAAGMNPYHYGAGHWVHHDDDFTPVTTTKLMFRLQRLSQGSGREKFPVNPQGTPVPYPLGIRHLDFGGRFRSCDDAPYTVRDGNALTLREPFTTTVDVKGSPAQVTIRENRACDLLRGQPWRCAPQPHHTSVVSLYLDGRDALGRPQRVDRFYIEPITSGVRFHLYYSPDPPPAGAPFTGLDDPLTPELLVAGGTTQPAVARQGIVFAGSPGWLTVADQAAGTAEDIPWWAGIEVMPGFSSSDTGIYMVADTGQVQLFCAAGTWTVTLPGGAVLGSWSFDFAVGDRLRFLVGFTGTEFVAWTPGGILFGVPAVPPVPASPRFRFGGPLRATYDQLVAARQPAAWWKLADKVSSPVADDSTGNGFSGAATGVTFNSQTAPTGDPSASFDGVTSQILTGYEPAGLTAMTIEGWCSYESRAQTGNARIVANSTPATDHGGFALLFALGVPSVQFGTGSSLISVAPSAGFTLSTKSWHHIVATWDGALITLYADGQEIASGSWAGPLHPGTQPVGVGYDPASGADHFAGGLAEVAIYPYALTASQVQASYAASTLVTGNHTLTAFVLKQESLPLSAVPGSADAVPQQWQDFAADPSLYVFPALEADQVFLGNAVARFSPQLILGTVCPWGFVGGLGAAYEACTWVPVPRSFKLATGFTSFDPVVAAAWKFEFTALQPEPYDYFKTQAVKTRFFPGSVLPPALLVSPSSDATLDTGLETNQAVAPTIKFTDAPAPIPDPPRGVPLPTEGLYATEPEAAGRMIDAGGSLYGLQPWQPSHIVPQWAAAQQHNYREAEVKLASRVGYFVAISKLLMCRLDYTITDDTEIYLDIFADSGSSTADPSTLGPGGWVLVPGNGLVVPISVQGPVQAESLALNSAHDVTGVQFATVQSEPRQLLTDPDFTDPKLAGWAAVGAALPLTRSQVSSQLGTMAQVSRGGDPGHPATFVTWNYLESNYPQWSALPGTFLTWVDFTQVPLAAVMGGIAYTGTPVATAAGGRVYAAARVFAPQALTAPLYLQLLDGSDGSVIAEAEQVVSGGAITEWFAGANLGQTGFIERPPPPPSAPGFGATVFGAGTQDDTIREFAAVTGLTVTCKRVYLTNAGTVYTNINQFPGDLRAAYDLGLTAVISLQPTFSGSVGINNLPTTAQMQADQTSMVNCLNSIIALGIPASRLRVTMWHEVENPDKNISPAQYLNLYSGVASGGKTNYAALHAICPVYHIALADEVSGNLNRQYLPFTPTLGSNYVDAFLADYYGNNMFPGSGQPKLLPKYAAMADDATPPLPFGIAEFGSTTSGTNLTTAQNALFLVKDPITIAGVTYPGDPVNSVEAVMAARVATPGKVNAEVMWYANYTGPGPNAILSSSDPRIPMLRQIVSTLSSTANGQSATWAVVQAVFPSWAAIIAAGLTWGQIDPTLIRVGATVTVQLIQKDLTGDTWDVDNISVFEDPLLWEFSNDGGSTWQPAYDIRNNPRGAITFPSTAAAVTAGRAGQVGATVFDGTYDDVHTRVAAADEFDGFAGRPMGRSAQVVYFEEGAWPSGSNPKEIADLLAAGVDLLICVKPARSVSGNYTDPTETTTVGTTIGQERISLQAAMILFANIGCTPGNTDITTFNEPQDMGRGFFPRDGAQFKRHQAWYVPVVQQAGFAHCYKPLMADGDLTVPFYPGDALTDKIYMDYYSQAYLNRPPGQGHTLANSGTLDLADNHKPHPIPVGIGEMGIASGPNKIPTIPAFVGWLQEQITAVFAARLAAGKTNAHIMWYDAGAGSNGIDGSTPAIEIQALQAMYDALSVKALGSAAAAPQEGVLDRGTQLKWRLSAFRSDVFVSGLAIRPWYVAWPQGIMPRAAGIGHGPNVSPHDDYPEVADDPRWKTSSSPIPESWYFSTRQALAIGPPPEDFPAGVLVPPVVILGSALVYQAPA